MAQKRGEKKQPSVRALDKALGVLEILSQIDGDIDLGVLAGQVRLPKSTLLRLLTTLRRHDFVQQDPLTRRYRLGWALIYLGRAASKVFDLAKIVRPHLELLAAETGETASLVQLGGNRAVYVDQVASNSMIRGVPQIGASLELHCTASGKILLSSLREERIDQLLRESPLQKRTEKTITDPGELKEELQRIHRLGYALDDEEMEIGGRCIAAPVTDRDGHVVAAFSITGPTSRIKQKDIPHLAEVLCRAAGDASRALGAVGTPDIAGTVR
jgi:IclR family acetate operon transcriptional repressor